MKTEELPTNLTERKVVLDGIVKELEDFYQLKGKELLYIIPQFFHHDKYEDLTVDLLIHILDLYIVDDSSIVQKIVDDLIAEYPSQYKKFNEGDSKMANFFVGQSLKQNISILPKNIIDYLNTIKGQQ